MDRPRRSSSKKGPAGAAEDRRVQRTRKLLSDAFVALVLERGYDAVSVQDVVERANVGRSTFYAHFENKEQLMLWGHEHLKRLVLEAGAAGTADEGRIDFLALYRHVAEVHALARLILRESGGAVVVHHLESILRRNLDDLFGPAKAGSKDEWRMFSLVADAAAAALVRLLLRWLEGGMPFSPEEMAARSRDLVGRIFQPRS